MNKLFVGSATALVTPFTENGIQFDAFAQLIDQQIEGGTAALVVTGTTGEPSTMTSEEKAAAISFCVRHTAGRVPVIAGTGSNSTATAVEQSRQAQELGADALLVVTPYYNKCNTAGLAGYYHTIANATNLPIIVYNVPSRTCVNVTCEALTRIAQHPRIAGVKEASGSIPQMMAMQRACPHLAFYSGSDEANLALLACGAQGIISVAANIAPRACHDLVEKALSGDLAGALAIQRKLNPLIDALFIETSPIPVKTALNLMGLAAGPLRSPLAEMEEAHKAILKKAMIEFGLPVIDG
jgi:4-hydroxy-tetrahydrodipicolinate synthase